MTNSCREVGAGFPTGAHIPSRAGSIPVLATSPDVGVAQSEERQVAILEAASSNLAADSNLTPGGQPSAGASLPPAGESAPVSVDRVEQASAGVVEGRRAPSSGASTASQPASPSPAWVVAPLVACVQSVWGFMEAENGWGEWVLVGLAAGFAVLFVKALDRRYGGAR